MPPLLRTFIAVELPPPVVCFAGRVQEIMRAEGIRLGWVRPENLHLTLKFLGDIEADRIAEIKTALASAAQDTVPFSLSACRVGVFPGLRQPRVVWLGIEGQVDQLLNLQGQVESALSQVGITPEKRPFKGHLTLGRVKNRIDPDALQRALIKAEQAESVEFMVESLTLFKSDLKPAGAIYTRLAEARLTIL
ncbi:MAG: RNA 2',3'-cyclic phosphodiesterase [Desulfobacterales bacterium]|jgi:2'-5' RNA ligase|nr:RNA 2',3'-cyclic phosphodiesterase [Desulfobacterales bacterium]